MCLMSYFYPLSIPIFIKKSSKYFLASLKKRPFPLMALNQVHEWKNKIIKGLRGTTSLLNTQDESAVIRWETCSPEVARIVSEFKDSLYGQDASRSAAKHYEDNKKFRQIFNRF